MIVTEYPAASDKTERALLNELRYLARQPILDSRGQVHGYELLFRSGPHNAFDGDDHVATCTMLDNSIVFGLEKLSRGLPAFVNCTPGVLIGEQVRVLPPRMAVLEILETAEPTPELIGACMRLKSLGYRIALDDFTWRSSLQPLVSLADYVKVDFLKSPPEERRVLLSRLPPSARLIAEKVETRADFDTARVEGFSLFQGFYFCAPAMLRVSKIPSNKVCHLLLLQLLQQDPVDIRRLSELVKLDAGLTYRLLRLVNSPACAFRQEVRSIEMALLAVGEYAFRRLASLAIASELNSEQNSEILRVAFVRARFCELAAQHCGLDSGEQYLIGLFSMLPAMLKVAMPDILLALPLRQQVREALLGQDSPIGNPLRWVEAEEHRQWQQCHEIAAGCSVNPGDLVDSYLNAVLWADQTLPSTESAPSN